MNKLLTLLFLLLSGLSFGQEEDVPFDKRLFPNQKEAFMDAVKEIKEGDYHFFDGTSSDLTLALRHYLYAQDFNPYSSVLNFKIGVCYLNSNHKFNALEHLKFAYKVNPDVDENIKFYLAQAHQLAGEFDTAIYYYQEFKDQINPNDQGQRAFINKKIQECRTGQELKESPIRVWIDNLGDSINTEYPEFSPVISADNRVLFFTGRRPDSEGGKKDQTGFHYEDVYVSKREYGGDWQTSENIGDPVNTESHDATVGLSPDGKSLLTYKGINSKNGDIFITKELEDGTWAEPVSIGDNINTKYHESSASLSFDEKTLFFVSDQPGGFGQHDIYVSYWDEEKSEWGKPYNLGPTINTEFEEKGVFFHPDNKTLYFSSNGHNNMGGLDIFKTEFNSETGEWSEPENIGYPINTPDDDIYFVVTGNERYAYYSSFREDGFGEKDIYQITFLGERKNSLLADADLMDTEFLEEESSDLATSDGTSHTDNNTDNNQNNNQNNTDNNQNNTDNNNQNNTDNNQNNTDNNQNNNTEDKNRNMIIKGHVKDCKTSSGIQANIVMVNNETGARREITSNPDGSYEVIVEAGESYAFTVSSPSYNIDSKSISTTRKDKNTERVVNFELCPPSQGSTFTLRNIYFDFDKYGLRDKSVADLNLLAQVMKENPNMIIELGGHTDTRGSSEYNEILSLNRAKVAKEYLVKKGIDPKRIYVRGYGEKEPEIPDSEIAKLQGRKAKNDAHQQNRRTVVTIIRN
ncbi:MAG: PD40 domain-containing protein [Crocinitomicaceae bacterium]|nr:PD40 domain-containing protein [Crocinitomicaceae bacterium]